MGFLGEIRKLLFGVKSVSKSGAEKVADKSQEIGEEILERGSKAYAKSKDVAEDVVENTSEKISDIVEKAKHKIADMSDRASENPTVNKVGDFTEKVGREVIDKGGKALSAAGDLSEKVGEKVLDAKDKLMDKAKEVSGKMSDKFDETYEKAKKLEAEEALEGDSKYADTPIDIDKSLLEDSDDFFAKAEKFADGNYSGKEDKTEAADQEVEKTKELKVGETTISLPEGDRPKKPLAKAAGFDDLDGDGNEVVDDAIIVKDDIAEATDEVVSDVEDQVVTAGDIATSASDHIKSDVDKKVGEMGDMIDKVLGEEE